MSADATVKPLNFLRHKASGTKLCQDKKGRVSLSLSVDLLKKIDEMKSLASRSAFVEKLLRDQLTQERE